MIEKINTDCINEINIEKCLWFTTISHPLKEDRQLSLMLLKEKTGKIYLLIADCESPNIIIEDFDFEHYYIRRNINLSIKALANDDNIFLTLFDLTYTKPKDMTQAEIEKILGYPINIVK